MLYRVVHVFTADPFHDLTKEDPKNKGKFISVADSKAAWRDRSTSDAPIDAS